MTITDEMLYGAAPDAAMRIFAGLPCREDSSHVFSPGFEQKMRSLLRKPGRKRPWRALLVAAVIVGTLAAGLTVGADQRADCQVYWSQSAGEVRYTIRVEHDSILEPRELSVGYVPADCVLEQEGTGSEWNCFARYGNPDGKMWFQIDRRSPRICTGLLVGNYQGSEVGVSGRIGVLMENVECDNATLLWTDGPCIFSIGSHGVTAEELLKIAEGIS